MSLVVEKYYFPNGNPFFKVSYLNKQKKGLSTFWWRDNMIDVIKTYKRDIQHGIEINFEYTRMVE